MAKKMIRSVNNVLCYILISSISICCKLAQGLQFRDLALNLWGHDAGNKNPERFNSDRQAPRVRFRERSTNRRHDCAASIMTG